MSEVQIRCVYPEGAIKSLHELEALISRAKTDKQDIQLIVCTEGEAGYFRRCIDWAASCEDGNLNYCELNPARRKRFIPLQCLGFSPGPALDRRTFLFTNYWHAYAYAIRQGGAMEITV